MRSTDTGRRHRHAILDRLLQFRPEPGHLRLLQPGLQGGLQGHADLRAAVLFQLLEEPREVPLAEGRLSRTASPTARSGRAANPRG